MNSFVVFCGSKKGNHPAYEAAAKRTGELFVQKDIKLVYGGGGVGLMGIMAKTVMKNGGKVIGVITDFLQGVEGIDIDLSNLIVVPTMHERKQRMAALSNAVLVLPGAFGTLDELFEMLTLVQLSQGNWPIGIYNVNGYYNHLLKHIELLQKEGFLSKAHQDLILVSDDLEELIDILQKRSIESVHTDIEKL